MALVLVTSIFGLVLINSADPSYTLRQGLGIVAATVWMVFLSFVDYNKILKHYKLCYIIAIVLLALVLVVGKTAMGAQRWIPVGPINLQPSEIAKILLVIFLAARLMRNRVRIDTW